MQNITKSSIRHKRDRLKETVSTHSGAIQTVIEDIDFEYVMDLLVGHQNGPDVARCHVLTYGYNGDIDKYKPKSHIQARFATRYWRLKATRLANETPRQGRRVIN